MKRAIKMTHLDGLPDVPGEAAKNLAVLYRENAEVTKTFWEWRHKLMTRFFTACAGIVVGASWMYERDPLRPWLYTLFFVGAVFCVMTWVLDLVNTRILRNCYRVGREIEERLSPTRGIYKCIDENYGNIQYFRTLTSMYLGSAVVLLAMTIVAGRYIR
jgi:hypothetical protein